MNLLVTRTFRRYCVVVYNYLSYRFQIRFSRLACWGIFGRLCRLRAFFLHDGHPSTRIVVPMTLPGQAAGQAVGSC